MSQTKSTPAKSSQPKKKPPSNSTSEQVQAVPRLQQSQGREPPPLFPNVSIPAPPALSVKDQYLVRKSAHLKQRFRLSPCFVAPASQKYSDHYRNSILQAPDFYTYFPCISGIFPEELLNDKLRMQFRIERKKYGTVEDVDSLNPPSKKVKIDISLDLFKKLEQEESSSKAEKKKSDKRKDTEDNTLEENEVENEEIGDEDYNTAQYFDNDEGEDDVDNEDGGGGDEPTY